MEQQGQTQLCIFSPCAQKGSCGFWLQGERRFFESAPYILPSSHVIMLGLELIQDWENKKLSKKWTQNKQQGTMGWKRRVGWPENRIIVYKDSIT